jgi:hypothetical protein
MIAKISQGLKMLNNATALFFEKGAEAMTLAAGLTRGTKKLKLSLMITGKEETQHEPS